MDHSYKMSFSSRQLIGVYSLPFIISTETMILAGLAVYTSNEEANERRNTLSDGKRKY